MIATELTRRLGIEHPIIQAGMGGGSGPALAAAVSNAGALGTLASIGMRAEDVRNAIEETRKLTGRPFALNIVTFPWAPFWEEIVETAIAERPPVVTLSFGTPLPALRRCQEAGIPTIVQVQDLAGAKAALAANPAALIVQGNEAGGHTGRRGTLSFAAQVLDLAGGVPVLLAGGIANGRGLAAAIAMGAAGAVIGTRFKATVEFGGHPLHKQAIVESDGSNTIYDEVVDLGLMGRWPNGVTGRVIRNGFTDEWEGRAPELEEAVNSLDNPRLFMARYQGRPEMQLNWAGESSGLVDDVIPAAEVVRRTMAQAEELLGRLAGVLTR
jgi:NAD(P)H-dependent flavin oxidoreductase YrpB (nitropropane dioxygenase family)